MQKHEKNSTHSPNIVIMGAGKVAWHLGHRFAEKGLPVLQILNRSEEPARKLAQSIGATYSTDFQEIVLDADWYVLAVNDDAIREMAEKLAKKNLSGLVVHTSGATPGKVLEPHFLRWGVCWPLQSFSIEKKPTWGKIPFCLHAGSESDLIFLEKLTRKIGAKPYRVNDEQRAFLHVAAVFANNFANHCFAVAEQILKENKLPFGLLHPLMQETLDKALADSPAKMQTGPAIRGDSVTLLRQLALLERHPDWATLYQVISRSINPDAIG